MEKEKGNNKKGMNTNDKEKKKVEQADHLKEEEQKKESGEQKKKENGRRVRRNGGRSYNVGHLPEGEEGKRHPCLEGYGKNEEPKNKLEMLGQT